MHSSPEPRTFRGSQPLIFAKMVCWCCWSTWNPNKHIKRNNSKLSTLTWWISQGWSMGCNMSWSTGVSPPSTLPAHSRFTRSWWVNSPSTAINSQVLQTTWLKWYTYPSEKYPFVGFALSFPTERKNESVETAWNLFPKWIPKVWLVKWNWIVPNHHPGY